MFYVTLMDYNSLNLPKINIGRYLSEGSCINFEVYTMIYCKRTSNHQSGQGLIEKVIY